MEWLADVNNFAGFGGKVGSMNLRGLSGALDGFKERGTSLVKGGLAATGAVFGWGYLEGMIPAAVDVHPAVKPVLQGVAGVAAAEFLDKYDDDVAMGAGIGLVSASLVRLAGIFIPSVLPAGAAAPVAAGLAAAGDAVFVGGGFGRMLSGAPVAVEEATTLAAAPVAVEEAGMAGVASILGG